MSRSQQRILALDVGDARTGTALSDPLGMFAQPGDTFEGSPEKLIPTLSALVIEKDVGRIVVGLPKELSGEEGPQAQKVRSFVGKLESALRENTNIGDIPLIFWDERMSTQEAKRYIQESKLKNRERSAALDRVSASLILESYLQSLTF